MKKLIIPLVFALSIPLSFSRCNVLQGYQLTEQDAIAAIRQMLEFGTRDGVSGAFGRDVIMDALFPQDLRKVLNTLQQLGLTQEVDRFTNTLTTAAEKTATNSIPIFLHGIATMRFSDAIRIIKNGGHSATDYLRTSIGDSLRRSITPVMQNALNEYNLGKQWDDITKPVRSITGNRLNLDLAAIMAGVVSEAMFRKIEQKEEQIRTSAAARTTPLLQRVFSRDWNM